VLKLLIYEKVSRYCLTTTQGRKAKRSVGTVEGFIDLLEGDVNFQTVKEALFDIGYDGYVTAELLPFESGRPEKTEQAMKKIFK